MALLSIYIGLSMAIGAFLMGMMIAGSRKGKEVNHKIEPMRDLFMAIFFISIGMQITISSLVDNIGMIVILYLVFLVLIVLAVFVAYWVGNEKCRDGFLSAISLATMGEFAFIIANEALGFGAIDQSFYTSVVGAALMSMVILPFLSRYAPRIWDRSVDRCPRPVYAACCNVNAARERLYTRIYATSKKSRKTLYRSMTHAYINILAIIGLQIAFYFIIPFSIEWLSMNFGGTRDIWSIVMIVVNFVALMPPVYHLVNNVKFLDEMIIGGARRIAKREGNMSEPGAIYQRFLEINTYLMVLILVAVIVIVSPNSVGLWQHIIVLALAVAVLVVFYLKKYWDAKNKRTKRRNVDVPEKETDDDSGDVQRCVVPSVVLRNLIEYSLESHVACDSHAFGVAVPSDELIINAVYGLLRRFLDWNRDLRPILKMEDAYLLSIGNESDCVQMIDRIKPCCKVCITRNCHPFCIALPSSKHITYISIWGTIGIVRWNNLVAIVHAC